MPNVTSRTSVDGGGFKQHALQESRELADKLKWAFSETVLVPDPQSATGFRALGLEPRHQDGFGIDADPVSFPAPHAALLDELGSLDKRVSFVPEVHSNRAGRNVRFLVSLPPGFDPSRKEPYRIVTLMPAPPPGTTIAQELRSKNLNDRLGRFLGSTQRDTVVLMPERFEHRFGAVPLHELESLANDVVDQDLLPYVKANFNAGSGSSARYSIEFLDGRSDDPVGGRSSSSSSSSSSRSDEWALDAPKPKKKGFFRRVFGGDDDEGPSSSRFDSGAREVKKQNKPEKKEPPQPKISIEKIDLAGAKDTKVAVVFPVGFDPKADQAVRVVLAEGASPDELGKALRDAATPGTVVVAVDAAPKTAAATSALLNSIARELGHDGVDLDRMTVQTLGADRSSWVAEVKSGAGAKSVKLQAPVVATGDGFKQLAPTTDYKEEFPFVPKSAKTSEIPQALQKQSATAGTFFAPIYDSKALGGPVRFGVYLPPGYDPSKGEKYPVMMLLPGRRNPLHYWTSAGQLVPKLDKMMQGQAQKMIVVIPDNNDSFYFDYDNNGHPTTGEKGKRNYEGHVMDELLGYATEKLNGDPSRLAIGGISRGGFGAMSLALRHEGKFASVSSTAGVLDLEHTGGVLAHMASSVEAHFGPADDPVWSQVNPADLVKEGKFGRNPPRIRVEVGAEDPLTARDALSFASLLDEKKIGHDFHFYKKDGGELVHNWDAWEPTLEETIAFHQASFGAAGPATPAPFIDDAKDSLKAYRADLKKRWDTVKKDAGEYAEYAQELVRDAKAAMALVPADPKPFEPDHMANLRRVEPNAERIVAAAEQLKAGSDGPLPLHAAEAAMEKLEKAVEGIENAVGGAQAWSVGKEPAPVAPDPKSLTRLTKEDRAELDEVMKKVPSLREPLVQLATQRPGVFAGEDPLSGVRFSEMLRRFVTSDQYKESDEKGLGEFVRRMAERRFDWRRGGFSQAVCMAMNSVYNHPGLILDMVMQARLDKPYPVSKVYDGDGARELKPLDDFKDAFSPVKAKGELPAAQLGYERGWLRAIVEELASDPKSFPPERFARNCDPTAVGLSKILGEQVRYGYAYKIKSGDDLVKAVQSQGENGLAFADVYFRHGTGPVRQLHFPVFYDYDPKTRTLAMQEWTRGERRISVDDFEFMDKDFNGDDARPAIYYRDSKGLEPFLTPEYQKNWKALSKAAEGDGDGKKASSDWLND